MRDAQHWTTGLDDVIGPSHNRLPSHEEWLANLRDEWQTSGTELDFDAWRKEQAKIAQAKQLQRMRDEFEAEQLQRRITNLRRQTPALYAGATTDNSILSQWSDALIELDKAEDPTGPSVLIAGPTGTGKTHAMFGALRHYVEAGGTRLLWIITAADMYARMRPRQGHDSEETFNSYASATLLAVDDLGASKSTEWTDEINYRLFNHRYNAKLPTVVTTNVPPKELGEKIGDRVASRLAEMMTTVVLKGTDRRRKAH